MLNLQLFALACVATLSVATLVGCSTTNKSTKSTEGTSAEANKQNNEAGSELRFMWWGGETRHKATVDALELYKEAKPNVTVKTEYSGWDGYFDKLTTDEYIEKGLIDVSNLSQATLDMYRIDGKLYAIPAGVSTSLLFYNKDYFDQAGVEYPTDSWTWEDYMEAARKLTMDTNGDGEIDVWGTAYLEDPAGADITFKKYVYERGGKLWSDDLKSVAFNSAEGLAAVEFIKKPLEEGIMPPLEITASNPQNVDDFQTQRVAMIIHYSPIT
ncbi:MAG: hypothetical protein K0S18_247, partial [Anaerocolumna sp.]|nr:hypothetical protein [Anaerocolumna sp.]